MVRKSLSAATLIALAAFCTPALAHVAPFSSPDPPPLPIRFLIGIALMAVAGAIIVWQGAALARETLGHERGRRHRTGSWRLLVIGPAVSPYRVDEPTLSLAAGPGCDPARGLEP